MIFDIFKIGVYAIELSINNDVLIEYANTLEKNTQGNLKSNRGGFQSDDLVNDCLNELQTEITKHGNEYAKSINYTSTKLTNIWCNINYYKDYNVVHDHRDLKISGVYYAQTPKDCGNIVFYHPGWQLMKHNSDSNYTASSWWLPAEKGMLYLFPSWLLHHVESNLNKDEKRISYSFNLE